MTKHELYDKLTGTKNPRFLTKREEKMLNICLEFVNSSTLSPETGPPTLETINEDDITYQTSKEFLVSTNEHGWCIATMREDGWFSPENGDLTVIKYYDIDKLNP